MISFIVPLHNHLKHTQEMLGSLLTSLPEGLDFEVILVDDASSDGTAAWLSHLDHPRVRWLINPQNLGYAEANNRGAAEARGDVLGLLNNDLLFAPGWLEPMLNLLTHPQHNAGLVGNVQRRVAGGEIDHAGIRLNLKGQFEHVRALEAGSAWVRLPWVTGACMLIRRDLFDAVGGFDTRYRNGCEDVDLCFKVAGARKAIYVARDSCIQHHVSLSRKCVTDRDERNSRALFARWRSEIKRELAKLWAARLTDAQAQDDASALADTLTSHFIATPHAAGRTLAEALLQQQEQRWARMLDGAMAKNDNLAARSRFAGLQFNAALNGFTLAGTARVTVDALPYARNFYVCGHTLANTKGYRLQLHIDINGLQHVRIPLRPNTHFNAGLAHPLLLNGVPNVFTLRVERLDENGTPCGSGHEAVVVGHFVVDEQPLSFELLK